MGAALALWRVGSESLEPQKWNVVLVTADTLRADKLGCYGNARIDTPHLDALASTGVLFENAASSAPITLPAHASIFTGTYPIHHGVRDNGGYYLEPQHETLAESLREQGYATGAFVGAFVLDSRFGLDQGFESYFDDFDLSQTENAALNSFHRPGGEVLEQALTWMDSVRDRPFFSWVHLYDPHRPYDPPEPFRSRYAGEPSGNYDGEVAYVDSLVGELVAWLETRKLRESTLLVFVGDHGEALGDHEELTHGFFVYDSTMRVPLILNAPSPQLLGRRVDAQVRTIDLMPTVLELIGAEVPSEVQGTSLVPLATGQVDDLELAAYGESVFPEHYGWAPLASLRTRNFHFIDAPHPELYDLESDSGEHRNIVSERAGTVRELKERLDETRARYAREGVDEQGPAAIDAETREKLEALGYLGGGASRSNRDPSQPLADPKDKIGIFKLIREASTDADEGRTHEAMNKLELALAEDPEIPEAYHLLGNLHAESGENDRAVAAYQQALARAPEYKPAIFGLALAYREMGQDVKAAAGLERILELDPRASQASFLLAKIEIGRERFEDALTILESIGPGASDGEQAVRHNLEGEGHIGLDELDEAERSLAHALELEPDLADVHYNLGLVLEKRGNVAGAAAAYEKEIVLSPENFRAHFNLGKLLGQMGRDAEMLAHLETTIELNPRFPTGHLYLANAYLERGNLERALASASRGMQLSPEPGLAPFGHFILADVYQRLGRPNDAAREMALAQKLQGSRPISPR